MPKIRALIIEDSLTVRQHLAEALGVDPEIEVVGAADNGKLGIELCQRLRPDVITLDIMLPVMSGLAAAEFIMAYCPTPILVVSSSTNRGEMFRTYDALAAGAVDVLDKPTGAEPDGNWERRLVAAVKLVSRIRVVTHPRARLSSLGQSPPTEGPPSLPAFKAVGIGASTGGPAAILQVLRGLPPHFPIPILLVLHLGDPFGSLFAEWLDGLTSHRVALASDGLRLSELGGRVTVAPPDRHMLLSRGRICLSSGPERHSCRPSVDVLFESIAECAGPASIACLLTGMGKDGAQGLLAVRRAGGFTVAQDEATSVVYGMPREAAALGAACRVTPIEEIGALVAQIATADSGRAS